MPCINLLSFILETIIHFVQMTDDIQIDVYHFVVVVVVVVVVMGSVGRWYLNL